MGLAAEAAHGATRICRVRRRGVATTLLPLQADLGAVTATDTRANHESRRGVGSAWVWLERGARRLTVRRSTD
jgi:hypothetical protein